MALHVSARGTKVLTEQLDSTQFLLKYPKGAYTSARTVNQKCVYRFNQHVNRLAQSAASMLQTTIHEATQHDLPLLSQLVQPDLLRTRVIDSLGAAMTAFRERHGAKLQPTDEFKLTVLSTWEPIAPEKLSDLTQVDLYSHITLLPQSDRTQAVRLEISGPQRPEPDTKSSQWVRDRQSLCDNDFEEVLLTTTCGQLLEGTQTNFFIVKDGAVVTADEHILKGTIRASVLEICEQFSIPVVLRPPKIDELHDAQGAFITSTSRLVLPVDEIVDMTHSGATITFPQSAVIDRIAQAVKKDLESKSSLVF